MMRAYYNEVDDYCCGWLSNLMDAGHITAGRIDDRSIVDVRPDDLAGYERCHFFVGIGGWDYALSLCGYSRPVWTGSCPCQPFSAAGKGKSADDERHLWPAWFSLIRECKPPVIFGEQVEAAIGWGWLDVVLADLEAEGYACGAAVLPACGVGAPHIRQRLWFVANSRHDVGTARPAWSVNQSETPERERPGSNMPNGELADADGGDAGAERLQRGGQQRQFEENGGVGGLAVTEGKQRDGTGNEGRRRRQSTNGGGLGNPESKQVGRAGQSWRDCSWLPCTDRKARPVEPGTFPLAHGIPGRVGRLRAYGNAIVPQVAAEFIKSVAS
jgi:DNA (cytosine-5)-methyltransferase 1